ALCKKVRQMSQCASPVWAQCCQAMQELIDRACAMNALYQDAWRRIKQLLMDLQAFLDACSSPCRLSAACRAEIDALMAQANHYLEGVEKKLAVIQAAVQEVLAFD